MQSHELLPLLSFLSADKLQRLAPPSRGELDGAGPRTFLLRGGELAALKARVKSDPVLAGGLAKLRDLADAQLAGRAPSVTHKTSAPEGGTINDYCSHAIYYWPNPESADGLPYVRRDGEVNPEIADQARFDAKRLERFANALFVLSLAYYLTEEEAYGKRAALLLRTWFVTPKTRQTPHFKYAQAITGGRSGSAYGLIEARRYLYVLDAEALLDAAAGWTAKDKSGFRAWFAAFDEWLRTSAEGREAAAMKNNIGQWTDLQLAAYALLLDRKEDAAKIVRESVARRLPEQVAHDGSQPQEASRARPYDYAAFNLLAMMGMARVGEAVGFDAWWAESSDGRTYARAMDWLARAAKSEGAAPSRAELEAASEALAGQTRALEQTRARAKELEAWADELASRNRELAAKLAEITRREGALEDERRTLQANHDARERDLTREREKRAAIDERLKKKVVEAEAANADLAEARRRLEMLDAAFATQEGALRAAQARTDALTAARDQALAEAGRWAVALQTEQERSGILMRALDAARAEADRRVEEARAREEALRVRLAEAADAQQRALEAADVQRVEERARVEAQAAARIADTQAQLAHAEAALAAMRAAADANAAELEAVRIQFAQRDETKSSAEAERARQLQAALARASLAEQALAAALEHMARRSGEAEAAQERARAMEAALFEEVERNAGKADTLDAKSRRMVQALKSVPPILAKNAEALAAAEARAAAAEAALRGAEQARQEAEGAREKAAQAREEAERAKAEAEAAHHAALVQLAAAQAALTETQAAAEAARRTSAALSAETDALRQELQQSLAQAAAARDDLDAARERAASAEARRQQAQAKAEDAERRAQAARAAAEAARTNTAKQAERAARAEEKLVSERKRTERDLAVARERVEKANRTVNALTTSTSWRVTGPLRSAAKLFRAAPTRSDRFQGSASISASAQHSQNPPSTMNGAVPAAAKNGVPPVEAPTNGTPMVARNWEPPGGEAVPEGSGGTHGLNGSAPSGVQARSPAPKVAKKPVRAKEPPAGEAQAPCLDELRADYLELGLDKVEDTFVLFRIVGNDLYPRHKRGQSRENVNFILRNEPELPRCEKRWVLNRIVDEAEETAIMRLLDAQGQKYVRIPFKWDEYEEIDYDFACLPRGDLLSSELAKSLGPGQRERASVQIRRHKNNYVMHNNGARNIALREGKKIAKWILPWDGNCFVTTAGWDEITSEVMSRPMMRHFIVPMARITDNAQLLEPDFRPEPQEEPQIIFRTDALDEFDERHPYGRRPKVEMLWRLGVPGAWDRWQFDDWDLPKPSLSRQAKQFGYAGWVARLDSGQQHLESADKKSFIQRGLARIEAIIATIDHLDAERIRRSYSCDRLLVYEEERLERLIAGAPANPWSRVADQLRRDADAALKRGPYSVLDKTTLAPSNDPQDYWHPAPYWWPNPDTPDGLPFVKKDGERVPGTELYEAGSEKYDRTSLQRVFDDTTILALAWRVTGNQAYARHAAAIASRWFIDPRSRMNPHLRYSQVRLGHLKNQGAHSGVIEMKDLYYFLDAVRLLERSGALGDGDIDELRAWLSEYLEWLSASKQGEQESKAVNNHGTWFDVQEAAIAAFLEDYSRLAAIFRRSRERLFVQFTPDGEQPDEMSRTLTAHYCCFNLQGWATLASIAKRCGDRLWRFETGDGRSLEKAFAWLLPYIDLSDWPHRQIAEFDRERFLPLFYAHAAEFGEFPLKQRFRIREPFEIKPCFYPHDGIRPYWAL